MKQLLKNVGLGLLFTAGFFTTAWSQFTQAPLPYAYDALEPYIDARTMEIHYSKHHAGYVSNLNKGLEAYPDAPKSITALLGKISEYPVGVRNNAGGHYNHTLFWQILAPATNQQPNEKLMAALNAQFGSFDGFKQKMNEVAMKRFGSGWAWLVVTKDSQLVVTSTANQDNPLMDIAEVKGTPVLGIDVWEHAYYLKYQNKRGDYLGAIWNVINWAEVSKRYAYAMRSSEFVFKTWKALDDFHTIMDATFHPAEDGNVEPIKKQIKEMVKIAKALKKSKVPELFASEELTATVADLEKSTLALQKTLKNKKTTDEQIVTEFTALHDVFHKVLDLAVLK